MASENEKSAPSIVEPAVDAVVQDGNDDRVTPLIPEVAAESKPYVGQEFVDEASARDFYNQYAKLAGFSMRTNQIHTLALSGEVVWRRMVCSREGQHKKTKIDGDPTSTCSQIRRNPVSHRCGCKARIEISQKNSLCWTVSRFVEEHTHEMANPVQTQFLRSHCILDKDTLKLLKTCNEVGIGPSAACNLVSEMEREKGVNYTLIDVKNAMSRANKRRLVGHDAEYMIQYLQQKQDKNPSYYFSVRKDPEGSLVSLFWADGRSRIDFKAFKDVLCFDTTYRPNKNKMSFAPFVGLNHHKQIVVFGCGLITDETVDSFLWLFRKFRDAMEGESPNAIITDQDEPVLSALEMVFPNVTHKYCLCHIMRKVPEKLPKWCSDFMDFQHDFNEVVYNEVSAEDFESGWAHFLEMYDLSNHHWLGMLYEQRHKWVPIYNKRTRFYGMCTNQRSEGFHSLMDQHTCRNTSFLEFVKQVESALILRRKDEMEANKRTTEAVLDRRTSFAIEKFLFEVYTNTNFADAQKEMWKSNAYTVAYVGEDGEEAVYDVKSFKDKWDSRVVTYSNVKKCGKCSCMSFDSTGIVCRHLYAVFWMLNILELPRYFVLQRMTRDPRQGLHAEDSLGLNPDMASPEDLAAIWSSINAITSTHNRLLHYAVAASKKLLHDLEDLKWIFEDDESAVGEEHEEKRETSTHGEHLVDRNCVKNPKIIPRGRLKKVKWKALGNVAKGQ